jgi:hypothetical protein
VVIEATPEAILDVLADVEAVPSWSPVHKCAEVIDTHPDGRPHHVKVTVGVMGVLDQEILEYHWGPDWLVWDSDQSTRQHSQHVEYTLTPEAGKTRVRFDITLEPAGPVSGLIVKRASKTVLAAATDGLRERVLR